MSHVLDKYINCGDGNGGIKVTICDVWRPRGHPTIKCMCTAKFNGVFGIRFIKLLHSGEIVYPKYVNARGAERSLLKGKRAFLAIMSEEVRRAGGYIDDGDGVAVNVGRGWAWSESDVGEI